MQNSQSFKMTFSVICIAINIVLGILVSLLSIPMIFMDTMGTMIGAMAFGPFWGAMIGLATNLLMGFLTNPVDIPFALVNMTIGLVVGLVARKLGFNLMKAVVTGLVLAIVAPLIGTPIVVWIYGGLTGGSTDFIVSWLLASGQSIFTAAFLPRIAGNLVDKVVSCVIAYMLISKLPMQIKNRFESTNSKAA